MVENLPLCFSSLKLIYGVFAATLALIALLHHWAVTPRGERELTRRFHALLEAEHGH